MATLSLKARARRAGLLYFVWALFGPPVLLFLPKLIGGTDAGAVAQNIASHLMLYRWLMLLDFIGSIGFLVVALVLFQLFEDVDRTLARLMMLFVLASVGLGLIDVLLLGAPLVLRDGADYLSVFSPAQLSALALGLLKVRSLTIHVNEMFWGLWLIPLGMLCIKSGFVWRPIAWLLFAAAAGYVTISAAYIVSPESVPAIGKITDILVNGELGIILWLLIAGARGSGAGQPEMAAV